MWDGFRGTPMQELGDHADVCDFKGKPGRPGSVWQGQNMFSGPERVAQEALRVKLKHH